MGIEKQIQGIPKPIDKNIVFNKWIKVQSGSMYSILILDVSGSMQRYYTPLFDMANSIIENQMKNEENEGVIVLFADRAKAIINGKYRLLNHENDISSASVGSGTNFYLAFKEAEKYIYDKNTFKNKRILFLTDGRADSFKLQSICDKMINENFQISIVGFGNSSKFIELEKFATKDHFFTSNNFKEIEIKCKEIFAAE